MGGSGGGFSGYGTVSAKAQLLASEAGTHSSQREIEINEFLEELLKDFNSRDVDAIQTHLQEIEKVLGREIDGLDAILFGGSISKKTFIEGTSDVDALGDVFSTGAIGIVSDLFSMLVILVVMFSIVLNSPFLLLCCL